jgi:predicted dehydrogenase
MSEIGILIIGTGKIALANHLPGVAMSGAAKVVALCDRDPVALETAARQTGISRTYNDYHQALADPSVSACIVATPNDSHPEIVIAAAEARRHVLCEKPLALNAADALRMYRAAEAAGIRHMTAFTYRFVPAMRYTQHLIHSGAIGRPLHFRAQRFQDWGDRPLGWRQVKQRAGTGELADMLSHRIDYGHFMIGTIRRLVADLRTLVDTRGGAPSDVDDWVAMMTEFSAGATGVLESTKLAAGWGEGYGGRDVVEINGAEGSIAASTQQPHEIVIGKLGDSEPKRVAVPREFLVWEGSKRDPAAGDPRVSFRYDQDIEFINAIREGRPCRPSLREGVMAQTVMDAAVESARERRWMEIEYPV